MRPERFTEQAREIIASSQEIALSYRHSQWDVEHLFMALLRQDGGIATQVFQKLGVSVEPLKSRLNTVLQNAPRATGQGVQIYPTPRIVAVLESADSEARQMKDQFISVEHLLLAVTSIPNGDTAVIMKEFGVTKEGISQPVKEIRGGHRVHDP